MQHQLRNFHIIVEVERDVIQSVFYFLKDLNYPVFVEPTEEIIEKYLPINKEALIIKPLVSESPLQEVNKVMTVTIEKLLVDIFFDYIMFASQQGRELRIIFMEAYNKYAVNESKMLRYANRKRKKEILYKYIKSLQIYGSNWLNAAKL